MNIRVISIDGPIGAGKSSVIYHLVKTNPHFSCLTEPLEKYTLLNKFYKDKKTYAAPLQFEILMSQYDQFLKCYNSTRNSILISERSPTSSVFVFAQMLMNMGLFDGHWWNIYKSLSKKFCYNVDFYIYLYISPSTSYSRIQTRGRLCEREIGLPYLEALDYQYNAFYNTLPSIKWTKIDASEPLENVVQNVTDAILNFNKKV